MERRISAGISVFADGIASQTVQLGVKRAAKCSDYYKTYLFNFRS